VAFTNVSVVPMDDKTILADHTVVVTNCRISAMGPAASTVVPGGAMRVDGQGKYVMPGLAEMHGHVPPATAPRDYIEDVLFLYVANGVTTVRGMQGAPGQLELREAAARGDMIAPTLYLAGPAFSGNTVRTSEEATARVRQQKAEGWDLLKVRRPQMGLAGTIEFAGGLLIMVGLFAGLAAFIASGQMAFAYFLAHAPRGGWPAENDGELAVLFCFVFLFISARGAGIWSLDAALFPRRRLMHSSTAEGLSRA
jgi:uncharacterized membrane protein YphA (DoxX/SURF4 family)